MDCLTLNLRVSGDTGQHLGPPTPFESVRESLLGRTIAPDEEGSARDFPMMPFRIELAPERTFVEVRNRHWLFHTEKLGSAQDKSLWVEELVERSRAGHNLMESAIGTVAVETAWISPFEGDWGSLLSQYCRAFISPNAVPDKASDVSALFDATLEDAEVHIQSGPMNDQQLLQQYAEYLDPSEAPTAMLFVLHRYRTKSAIKTALPTGIGLAQAEAHRLESIFQEAAE